MMENISILTSKSWIKVINMYMYFTIFRFYTVIDVYLKHRKVTANVISFLK